MWSRISLFAALVALCATGRSFASDSSAWVVSSAEGAVEIGRGDAAPALADTGDDVAPTDRVVLGFGAKLSVVAVEGDATGRVVTVRGPAEGSLADLVAASTSSVKAPDDAVAALRTATTEGLGSAAVTRGAAGGPLRAVYPQGAVVVPCGDFLFVPEVDDLAGGSFEVRLFDADPSKGSAKPVATAKSDRPQVDLGKAAGSLVAGRKYWWQAAVRTADGDEAMAGEPASFTPTKAPAGVDLPPKGFDGPEQCASWHLLRAKSFVKAQLYADAYREYLTLAAAGGGGAAVDKECRNLEKKLGLDDAAVHLLTDAAGRTDGGDELELTDGRKLTGHVVSADNEAVLFQMSGTRYRVPVGDVKDVRYGTGTAMPSAAKFVTTTSKHYVITTNAGPEFAKEAARDLEGLFETFSKTFGDALGAHNAKNLKAKIYRDDADFAAFLAKEHPDMAKGQGFYFSGDSTLYLFRSFADGKEVTFPTLFHEGTHQLLYMRCNQDPKTATVPHYWLTESLPCYMEGLEWKGESLVLNRPPESRVSNFVRLDKEGKLLPLHEFFALTQAGYKSADLYDQGTAVFWHMMRRNDGKDAARFVGFVKDYLSGRVLDEIDKKAFHPCLADTATGYAEWFAGQFGSSTR
jgi:hypothetical protein